MTQVARNLTMADVGFLGDLSRYIATPTVAKHRVFAWPRRRPAG